MGMMNGPAAADDVTRGWDVAQQECSQCHTVANSPIGVATGPDSLNQLAQKAVWPQIPMRSWLSVVHQPRIPAVSRNETDLNALQAYINSLRNPGVPIDELVVVGKGPKGPVSQTDVGEDPLDVQRRAPAVQIDLGDVPADAVVEPPRCKNCAPPLDRPLN
ncbi:MAG: hypothetical protein GY791_20935 [Alphaproteobacteria bacterium]|nr:hypothetical protein [Alphaproteobacteria bacterium]